MLATPLSIQWGVMKVQNIAVTGFAFLSAYLVLWLQQTYGLDPFYSVILVFPFGFIIGFAVFTFVNKVNLTRVPVNTLLFFFGVLLIIEGLTYSIWKGDIRSIVTVYSTISYPIWDVYLSLTRLVAFIIGFGSIIVTYVFLEKTFFGKAIRAFIDDAQVAMMYGFDPRRIFPLLFSLSFSLCFIGGLFAGLIYAFTPVTSFNWIGKVFAITILAGMGSVRGVAIAGLAISIAEGITNFLAGSLWGDVVSNIMLVIILLFRPMGISGRSYE